MAIEEKRGCGYRKVGGLYLVGSRLGMTCDRLPYPVGVCRTCGWGIKPSRGIRWMDGAEFFGEECPNLTKDMSKPEVSHLSIEDVRGSSYWTVDRRDFWSSPCHPQCPICFSDELGKVGLMWVGERFYPTPESFELEAEKLGVCKRIAAVPKDIELGKMWILLVHPKGIREKLGDKHVNGVGRVESYVFKPAIFQAFKPVRIEKIVTDQTPEEEIEKLKERGITPVVVPNDDPDHNPAGKKNSPVTSPVTSPELAVT